MLRKNLKPGDCFWYANSDGEKSVSNEKGWVVPIIDERISLPTNWRWSLDPDNDSPVILLESWETSPVPTRLGQARLQLECLETLIRRTDQKVHICVSTYEMRSWTDRLARLQREARREDERQRVASLPRVDREFEDWE